VTQEQAGLWKVSQGHLTGTGEDDKAARIRHLQTDPDVEYWFKYRCDMNDPQNNYATYVNLLETAGGGGWLRLLIHSKNGMILKQLKGGVQTDLTELVTEATSPYGEWYNVYVKCHEGHVEVKRAKPGEDMTTVLETDDCTLTQTDYVRFIVLDGSKFSFDNMAWTAHSSDDHDINWAQFLHLDDDSPCVDTADPSNDIREKRDFDDQIAPIDIQGVGYELPQNENDPDHRPYDIGADEYPTPDPEGFTFWWEKSCINVDE